MILEVLDRILAIPKYILEHTCLKRQLIELLKPGRVPRHIGFIMDGNRRFAKERGLPTRDGHRAGTRALIHVCFFLFLFSFFVPVFNSSDLPLVFCHVELTEIIPRKVLIFSGFGIVL